MQGLRRGKHLRVSDPDVDRRDLGSSSDPWLLALRARAPAWRADGMIARGHTHYASLYTLP